MELLMDLWAGESSPFFLEAYEKDLLDVPLERMYSCGNGFAFCAFMGSGEQAEETAELLLTHWKRLKQNGIDENHFRRLQKKAVGQDVMPEIWFPNLGIEIDHLSRTAFTVFGQDIYWYGIFIGLGVILGVLLALHEAKRTGQNPDTYLDFIIYAMIIAIIGARLYYVIFSWDMYKDNLLEILNIREGGLAIYGGVID